MGITQITTPKLALTKYSNETHSVEGEVAVYRLKGQALFIFEKRHTSPEVAKLARFISSLKCHYLTPYFGNLFGNHSIQLKQDCFCFAEQKSKSSFWSFQNFTLRQQITKNKQEECFPREDKIWSLIAGLAQASTILIENGLYLDCNFENVYLSPLKNHQLYWGNALIGNGHRLYYQNLLGEKVETQSIMSPEELRGLRQGKMIARLDLERCVVFSLGVLAILYANNISDYTPIYDSKSHEIKQSALSNLTKQCRKRLSDKLIALLSQMTQETPTKRINFNQLLESLQISSLQNSQNSEEAKGVPELQTCISSKVTVKNVLTH